MTAVNATMESLPSISVISKENWRPRLRHHAVLVLPLGPIDSSSATSSKAQTTEARRSTCICHARVVRPNADVRQNRGGEPRPPICATGRLQRLDRAPS